MSGGRGKTGSFLLVARKHLNILPPVLLCNLDLMVSFTILTPCLPPVRHLDAAQLPRVPKIRKHRCPQGAYATYLRMDGKNRVKSSGKS